MAKEIEYTKNFRIHGKWDKCCEGTETRTYWGDFVIAEQNFYPDGTMDFEFFDKSTKYHLDSFNRAQINDMRDLLKVIAENKKEFYPEEFLD